MDRVDEIIGKWMARPAGCYPTGQMADDIRAAVAPLVAEIDDLRKHYPRSGFLLPLYSALREWRGGEDTPPVRDECPEIPNEIPTTDATAKELANLQTQIDSLKIRMDWLTKQRPIDC